jgi:hypothetical protein
MSFKSDIQATRSTAGNTGTAVIAGPIRLRAISVSSDGGGAGILELTTTSNSGTTLLIVDVPSVRCIYIKFTRRWYCYFLKEFLLKHLQMSLHLLCLQMFITRLS